MSRTFLIKATALTKKGRVIASSYNSYKRTHPIQAHFARLAGQPERLSLHAEIACLLRCKDVVPYELHIERYKKDGSPALAAPCPICSIAIKQWGVQRVSYTVG